MKIFIKFFLVLSFVLALGFWANSKGILSFSKENSSTGQNNQGKDFSLDTLKNQVRTGENEFSGTADDIIKLVNQSRSENGQTALVRNEKLMLSAQLKASDMKAKGYFDHVTPEGLQPWFFIEKTGYEYKTVGENLAEGYFSAQEVHQAWMNSEGHRKNILSKDFQEIGVAIVEFEQNGLKSYIAVEHFGTQLSDTDLVVKTRCDSKIKEYCADVENKLDEVKKVVKEQQKIINKAKKSNVTKESLDEAKSNLSNLNKIKSNLEANLGKCKDYIKKCDVWD